MTEPTVIFVSPKILGPYPLAGVYVSRSVIARNRKTQGFVSLSMNVGLEVHIILKSYAPFPLACLLLPDNRVFVLKGLSVWHENYVAEKEMSIIDFQVKETLFYSNPTFLNKGTRAKFLGIVFPKREYEEEDVGRKVRI